MASHSSVLRKQMRYLFAQNSLLVDYYHVETTSYSPITRVVTKTETQIELRLLEEGLNGDFSINSFYPRTPPEIERFDKAVSVQALDCESASSPFIPSLNDRVVIPATSALIGGQSQITYRVVGAVPRYVDGQPVTYLLYLLAA